MKIQIQRDQAVWERETFEVEVPDDWDPNDLDQREVLDTAIDQFDGEIHTKILDEAVFSVDTQVAFFLPDGTELEL